MDAIHEYTLEHNGRRFAVRHYFDEGHEPPWEWADGHGPVSEWTTRDKRPGERVLCEDRRSRRYYDYAEAIRIARRDGWDAPPYRTGTKGEQAARAVEADYEFLRAWCADEWQYVGVEVVMLDASGEESRYMASCWGVETWKDYHHTMARELADECLGEASAEFRRALREARERRYWAQRDVRTEGRA